MGLVGEWTPRNEGGERMGGETLERRRFAGEENIGRVGNLENGRAKRKLVIELEREEGAGERQRLLEQGVVQGHCILV
jgi:hypothetical protein